ncbi:DNA-binding protein [Novosphingobium umbonatum]|uniref:DNA-binding protein n=2 Tax=Novosphingobium umbonatum TaxID=1908524 RepID=A0A3S2V9I0_9SPHN|nr:DNA-binding protein [Novosphingobium umbonatum]
MAGNIPLMKTSEAAAFLGVSQSTLEKLRLSGNGPRYLRIAGRSIRYRVADLDAWAEAGACQSTSQYGATA